MSRLAMTAAHRLGREEAARRLKGKLSVMLERYGHHASDLHEEWRDSRLSFDFKTMGMRVSGAMAVSDTEVRLSAEVPFALVVFKRRIERRIHDELGSLLS